MSRILNTHAGDANPLVSIVCITYNQEQYLSDALNGFIRQSTECPFEIIIHDDASTDGTIKILKDFQEKYPSIVRLILQQKNQYSEYGFEFINSILNEAKGKYIAFCEGDDYWIDPEKLQKQVEFLERNHDFSISIHNAYRLNCVSNISTPFNSRGFPEKMRVADVVLRSWFSPTASFVFRNGLVHFPPGAKMNGDLVFLYQCARQGYIHYLDEISSIYRYSSKGSLSELSMDNKVMLYKKKLEFLRYVDQTSNFKYIAFTSLARIKVRAASLTYRLKYWINAWRR